MIEVKPPRSWKDLQTTCAGILSECGLTTEIEKKLTVVRGNVSVDVFAVDQHALLPSLCIIECKHWRKRVPQSVIHSVRSVAADCGASHAFVVSSAGFQKGAYEAARFTNLKLLNYSEFETYFEPIWIKKHLWPCLLSAVDPLVEYTEPINSRIFRKADRLSKPKRNKFRELRNRYALLAMVPVMMSELKLPFAPNCNESFAEVFPEELKTTTSARRFIELYRNAAEKAINQFDYLFGGRA